MQYLFNIIIGSFAFLCFTAILVRLNHLSWRTHAPHVVGMHVGMGILCVLSLFKVMGDGDGASFMDFITVSTISCWVFFSLDEWHENRPPERFKRNHVG